MIAGMFQMLVALSLAAFLGCAAPAGQPALRELQPLKRTDGLRLMVSRENTQPSLLLALPGHTDSAPAVEVIFPEHVTAKRHGSDEVEHLYLSRPAMEGDRPRWRRTAASLEY